MASEQACCPSTLPPVTTHNYQPQGKWTKLAGVDVYVVASPTSSGQAAPPARAILAAYDVFGVTPQTLQGCDRVAAAAGAVVFLPDFFEGDPLPLSVFPHNTEEKKQTAASWRIKRGGVEAASEKLRAVIDAAKDERGEWKKLSWGAYGLCWGGKLVALHSGKDTPFKASGQAHPGSIAVEDAKALTIPHICLFSKDDGSPQLVEEYGNALKGVGKENVVDKYDDMVHGWMSARSNFDDPKVVKEFEKGYTQLADFFKKHV